MKIMEFLEARLAEDEEAAQDAAGWDRSGSVRNSGVWCREGVNSVVDSSRLLVVEGDGPAPGGSQAEHIVRHDPARVLREVVAKRAILAEYPAGFSLDANYVVVRIGGRDMSARPPSAVFVRALASAYSDHPDYQKEWAL